MQRKTFFFLLEIPFSFSWVSCSSSSESESAFFFDTVSAAAASFLSFSWRNKNGKIDQKKRWENIKRNNISSAATKIDNKMKNVFFIPLQQHFPWNWISQRPSWIPHPTYHLILPFLVHTQPLLLLKPEGTKLHKRKEQW